MAFSLRESKKLKAMPQLAWKYWLNHAYFTFMFSITPMSAIAHETAYPAPHLTSRGSNIAEFNVQLDPARLEDQILSPQNLDFNTGSSSGAIDFLAPSFITEFIRIHALWMNRIRALHILQRISPI
jgi:hypothetical protein